MTEPRETELESELRRLRPAPMPEDFRARLLAARPLTSAQRPSPARPVPNGAGWWNLLRWLIPAASFAAIVVAIGLAWHGGSLHPAQPQSVKASPPPALKADDVQFDRQLVAAFDAVAELPGGEPVRFRCREWSDAVRFRDSARGVEIEQRKPRFEVIPVRFETY